MCKYEIFLILTAILMKIRVFRDVIPRRLVNKTVDQKIRLHDV